MVAIIMVKLRPIGLSKEDQEEPYTRVIPDRVQKLIDLYAKNHVEYPWSQEDRQEQIFEYRRTLKPETYKYEIEAVYRVRDARDRSKEYYFYQKKGSVENDNGNTEFTNSMTYGYAVELEHELKWNYRIKSKEPVRMRSNPTCFFKWDKDEVKKLLNGSEKSCLNFYIGVAGTTGQGNNPATEVLTVKDQSDYVEGDFEDLVILNKSGLMNYGSVVPSTQGLNATLLGLNSGSHRRR
ncbi:MAG: hypothetical protein ACRD42_03320 [Nitrososphaeraceae archaeon]